MHALVATLTTVQNRGGSLIQGTFLGGVVLIEYEEGNRCKASGVKRVHRPERVRWRGLGQQRAAP